MAAKGSGNRDFQPDLRLLPPYDPFPQFSPISTA
jgi:hypothetical protein